MQNQKDEAQQYIKGKIAEIIFEQMFGYAGKRFSVIPFGYESVMPNLIQSVRKSGNKDLLATVKNAPDFALISHEPEQVLLVEVKYRSYLKEGEVQKTATGIYNLWKFAWLFYATQRGFYFGKCADLMRGIDAPKLQESLVPKSVQTRYHKLLMSFVAQ